MNLILQLKSARMKWRDFVAEIPLAERDPVSIAAHAVGALMDKIFRRGQP